MLRYNTETIACGDHFVAGVVSPSCDSVATSDIYSLAEEAKDYYRSLVAIPRQTHSLNVGVIDKWEIPSDFPATDALISFNQKVGVGVLTADCVPIVVYAPDVEAVAAIHAGWKGTLGGIVDNTLRVLIDRGADPAKMKVIFGPSVSGRVYEVDYDLGRRFEEAGFGACVNYPVNVNGKSESARPASISSEPPRPHVDLQGVNMERLLNNGVKMENIRLSGQCTLSSHDEEGKWLYPSYRRCHTPLRLLTYICPTQEL